MTYGIIKILKKLSQLKWDSCTSVWSLDCPYFKKKKKKLEANCNRHEQATSIQCWSKSQKAS